VFIGPDVRWLAAGSALAGAAYLVRQLGALLPPAVLGGLLLTHGLQGILRPRRIQAVFGPFLPSIIIAAYFDQQRGLGRQEPMAATLAFWAEHGPGLTGIVLARSAEICSTLGLLLVPLSIGILVSRPALSLGLSQRWMAGALLLALAGGLVLRSASLGQSPLLPYTPDILSRRGFLLSNYNYAVTKPESIVVPEGLLVVATAAAIVSGGLMVLAAVAACSRDVVRSPAAVPLLFSLLTLGVMVTYHDFYDRYLLALLPGALLVTLLTFGRSRSSWTVALTGIALLAAWSVWWERDYLEQRAALWQAGLVLVERGIPPEEIDGGFE
jgi:hypothetical protein